MGDGLQARAALAQALQVVQAGVADGAVEAALTLTGGIDVPHAQAMGAQHVGSFVVGHIGQRLAPQGAENLPEMVLWVGIVTLRLQRRDAGKAPQHQ